MENILKDIEKNETQERGILLREIQVAKKDLHLLSICCVLDTVGIHPLIKTHLQMNLNERSPLEVLFTASLTEPFGNSHQGGMWSTLLTLS